MDEDEDIPEKPANEFLRDLAERLMRVPTMYGTDQSDVDRLIHIARQLEGREP